MAKTVTETAAPLKEEKVIIKIPKLRPDEEDAVVWVNEKRYLIKKGIEVEVPRAVAEILAESERIIQESYEYESTVAR